MNTLERVLGATGGQIDCMHRVLEKLSKLAPSQPSAVSRCLVSLVEIGGLGSNFMYESQVIALIKALSKTEAQAAIEPITSRLLARGWHGLPPLT
jgi:hypothetical protein